jgi:hypothetical protein
MKKLILAILFCLISASLYSQWIHCNEGLTSLGYTINCLAAKDNKIFAGTNYRIFVSTNYGNNWSMIPSNNIPFSSMAVNESYIFAGSYGYGLYFSTNNGVNWSLSNLGDNFVSSLFINGNNILVGALSGVYISSNNGSNWLSSTFPSSIKDFTVCNNNIFAATANGVYISNNNGINWTQTSLILWTNCLATNGNYIFAGTSNYGIYLSTNNGNNWYQTPLNNCSIDCIEIYSNNIFAGTRLNNIFTHSIYLSTNNGTSWTPKNQGFDSVPTISDFLILNNYIFAGTSGEGVWRRLFSDILGIKQVFEIIPAHFLLEQNYPNPFNPSTNIRYQIQKAGMVKISVYNMLGKEIETLVNEKHSPGTYEVSWVGTGYPSGVYFYKLIAGDYSETRKMVLIK